MTLTFRESQILDKLLEACSVDEMAKELGIKRSTVKQHLRSLYVKYELENVSGVKRIKLAMTVFQERKGGTPMPQTSQWNTLYPGSTER